MAKHTTATESLKTLTYAGLDLHKETIAVAVAEVGKADAQVLGIIPNDEKALRTLMRKLGPPAQLRVCYEAGPCGYVIHRFRTRRKATGKVRPDHHAAMLLEPVGPMRLRFVPDRRPRLAESPENCRNNPAATRIGRSHGNVGLFCRISEGTNMKRLAQLVVLTFVVVSVSACGGGSGTSGPYSVGGSYSGSAADSILGKGFLSISLTQNGSAVTGFWGIAYPGLVNGGSFSGTIIGSTLQGTATSSVPNDCSVLLSGSLNGSILTGSYAGIGSGCTTETGTFTANTVTVPVLGSYAGSLSDSTAGSGTLSVNLTQNTVYLAGTWSDAFTNPAYNKSGNAYGVVTSGNTIAFELTPSVSTACPLVATGTLSGSTISGSYNAVTCAVPNSGIYSVTLVP